MIAQTTEAMKLCTCPRCKAEPTFPCRTPKGRKATTTHWERVAELRAKFPDVYAQSKLSSLKAGAIVTEFRSAALVIDELMKGLGESFSSGVEKRAAAAKKCAAHDAPILMKDEATLAKLYEVLFFNICTDELFTHTVDGSTAQERWSMVEPFTR